MIIVSLPSLTDKDVQDFKKLVGYGIYKSPNFPHGLIVWEVDNNWLIETPFNLDEERTVRNEEVQSFLDEEKNVLHRILVDGQGIVKSLNLSGLQWEFVETLKQIWQDKGINWGRNSTQN